MVGLTVAELISHYHILHKLGAGGMGEVFLAEDMCLGRKVAIKFVSTELGSDGAARKRLVREARAAARLDHPGICSVYELGEEAGRSFIVMQYVEGETLARRMRRKSLDLVEVLDIAVQVASTLADAHAEGIIHRDIKPQNIMMLARGQVKVLDFGLAKTVSSALQADGEAATQSLLTEPGGLIGTAIYMSPEQLRRDVLDARSDIFSFGVVVYELVSGHHPFAADNLVDSISAILTHEPPPLGRYLTAAPPELNWIVMKALRKDRDERYQTIKGMLADLKNLKHRLEFEAELERSIPPDRKTEVITKGLAEPERQGRKRIVGRSVTQEERARKGSRIDSLAVLPLVNASANPDLEYLSDSITESIINGLSQLPKLRVVPRNTMFRYKGQTVDPQDIGAALSARAVLMGRVLAVGDHLVIGMELVDVASNSQLWGEHYNRESANSFEVQEEIAKEVSEKLRIRFTNENKRRLAKRHTKTKHGALAMQDAAIPKSIRMHRGSVGMGDEAAAAAGFVHAGGTDGDAFFRFKDAL